MRTISKDPFIRQINAEEALTCGLALPEGVNTGILFTFGPCLGLLQVIPEYSHSLTILNVSEDSDICQFGEFADLFMKGQSLALVIKQIESMRGSDLTKEELEKVLTLVEFA